MSLDTELRAFRKPTIARNRAAIAAVIVAIALLLAIPIIAAVLLGDESYVKLVRGYPGTLTALGSTSLRIVADASSWITAGALVSLLFLNARPGKNRLTLDGEFEMGVVKVSSAVWAASATALIYFDAADANGVAVERTLSPWALMYFIDGAYMPKAWLLSAVFALVTLFFTSIALRWQGLLIPFWCSVIAVLAPVMVGQVQVGPNHDLGSDNAMIQTVAQIAVLAPTLVLALRVASGRLVRPETLRRLGLVAIVALPVLLATEIGMMAFKLQGVGLLDTPTGVMVTARVAIIVALIGVFAAGWLAWRRGTLVDRRIGRMLTAATLLITAFFTVGVTMTRIPPPHYFAPTNIMHVLIGFEVDIEPIASVLLTDWRLNLLFAVIAVAALVVYYAALLQLRRRGHAWPLGRSVAWTLGWIVVIIGTSSGFGKYSAADFGLHMVVHMSLNMLAPMLLVMGGVVTLLLRATAVSGGDRAASFHDWLTSALNWPMLRFLYNPILVFVLFVASYYGLYLTGLFEEAIKFHWAHQAMNLHFLIVGYLYYGLVIGVDRPPRPLPHLGKLGFVLAAMPFHAFFGVILMTSTTVIAENFYRSLKLPWTDDLLMAQYIGGGVAWAGGEIPLLIVVITLGVQWARQDKREAARTDRHLDSGLDDDFEEYNAMLAKLQQRSTRTSATPSASASPPSSPSEGHTS